MNQNLELLAFLKNRHNQSGLTLESVIQMSDEEMETEHNWIQWAFPLFEKSNFNPDAPVLTERLAVSYQYDKNIDRAVDRFLEFLGIKPNDYTKFNEKVGTFNHNSLRITRLLKFLAIIREREGQAKQIFGILKNLCPNHPSIKFWENAAYKA